MIRAFLSHSRPPAVAVRALLAVAIPVALLVGCSPPRKVAAPGRPPAARVTRGELDPKPLYVDVAAKAEGLGAGPATLVAAGALAEGERIGAFVDIPDDACLLGYGRAASAIEDIDVAVFADEGNPVATDQAPDAHPTLLLCPPHPTRVYLALHLASGEGLVALAAQIVPKDRAAQIGRAVGARGGYDGPRPAEAWPGLDDRLREHRAALGGTWEELRRVAVAVDPRAPAFVGFSIDAGTCLDAIVVADDDVALLEVEAQDEAGHALARAVGSARDKAMTICSPLTITGSVSVRPHLGRGLAAVVLARGRGEIARALSVRPEIVWTAANEPLDVAERKREAALVHAGYGAAAKVQRGSLLLGRRQALPIDGAAGGACQRIDIAGGAPLAQVNADVVNAEGEILATSESSPEATVFVCARGKAELELETRARPGAFAAMIRPEPWKDVAFGAHPVAASRMLTTALAWTSGVPQFEGAPLPVKTFALREGRVIQYADRVPAATCLRIAVGAEGEGSGVELRIFDATSADELDRQVASRAARVEACASAAAARPVRIELRGSSGSLQVVVGARIIPHR